MNKSHPYQSTSKQTLPVWRPINQSIPKHRDQEQADHSLRIACCMSFPTPQYQQILSIYSYLSKSTNDRTPRKTKEHEHTQH